MWFLKSSAFLALILVGSIPAHAGPVSQLIVFGDSNVDIGNSFKASGGRVNGPPNYMGRASNGPLFVDYVSTRLGIPLDDYAFGGATTGMDVPVPGGVIPSVLTQIKMFTASLGGGSADPDALYIYSAGGNDLVGATPADLSFRIDAALINIQSALAALDALGAHTIVVTTGTPRPDPTGAGGLNGVAFAAALRSRVPLLDSLFAADIELFDTFALVLDMQNDPGKYGFTQPTAICITDPVCSTDAAVGAGYIQWDGLHKTTHVHALLANQLSAQVAAVPEPSTVFLLFAGFGMLTYSLRRPSRS